MAELGKPIKVLRVNPDRADVFTSTPEQLRLAIETIQDEYPPERRQSLRSFGDFPEKYRWEHSFSQGDFPAVQVRSLIGLDGIMPLVYMSAVGSDTEEEAESDTFIHVRPAQRTRAIVNNRPAGVAPEELINVIGIQVDPARLGEEIRQGLSSSLRNQIVAGSYDFAGGLSVGLTRAYFSCGPAVPTPPDGNTGPELRLFAEALQRYYDVHRNYGTGLYLSLFMQDPPPAIAEMQTGRHVCILDIARADDSDQLESDQRPLDAALRWVAGRLNAPGPRYKSDTLTLLMGKGMYDVYYWILKEGRDSPEVTTAILSLRIQEKAQSEYLASRKHTYGLRARATRYALLIESMLGKKRLRAVQQAIRSQYKSITTISAARNDPQVVLAALTKKERETILIAYENMIATQESVASNKCPHVPIANRIRRIPSKYDAAYELRKLTKYFQGTADKTPEHSTWILCNNCDHRVICPHAVALVEMEGRDAPYHEIQRVMQQYVGGPQGEGREEGDWEWTNYCRICSERISSFIYGELDELTMGLLGDYDPGLGRIIWGEAMRLQNYMRFDQPADPKKYAEITKHVCYPLLLEAEWEAFQKRRKRASQVDEDGVDDKTRLYAIIFAYAFAFNVIQKGKGAVGWDGVRKGSRPSSYAKTMLLQLLSDHNWLIKKVTDITPEYISERFREALVMIQRDPHEDVTPRGPDTDMIKHIMHIDPSYNYGRMMATIDGKLSWGSNLSAKAARKEFEVVMGTSAPEILDGAPTYARFYETKKGGPVAPPDRDEMPLGFPESLEHWIGGGAKRKGKGHPKRGKTKKGKAKKGKAKRSSTLLHPDPYWSGGVVSLKKARLITRAAYQLWVKYQKNPEYTQDTRPHEFFGHLLNHAKAILRPHKSMQYSDGTYRGVEVQITDLYDEVGSGHVWDIHVFDDGGEYTSAQIAALLGEGHTLSKSVDARCSVCNVLRTETGTLSAEKTYSAYISQTQMQTFFSYYETRCPEGGVHEQDNSEGPCSKCGWLGPTQEYYQKYVGKFLEETRSGEQNITTSYQPAAANPRELTEPVIQMDFGKVLRVAEIGGVLPNVIESIGLTEGRSYDQVMSGTDVPVLTGINDARILQTDAVRRTVGSTYSSLRNYHRLTRKNRAKLADLGEMLDAVGVPRHEHVILPDHLPELPPYDLDYFRRAGIDRVGSMELAKKAHRYIVQWIASFIVSLHDEPGTGPQWLGPLKRELAQHLLAIVLRTGSWHAMPGKFNYLIFYGDTRGSDNESDEIRSQDMGTDNDVTPSSREESEPSMAENRNDLYDQIDYDGLNDEPN